MLDRLTEATPHQFTEKHLRAVQRAVKSWRSEIARSLLREGAVFVGTSVADANAGLRP
ncbi:MAG: hypothetical protein ACREFO_15575 [Acetobacteraceae bacterium]